MTFSAPPVEPAEAPIIINISRAALANDGQRLKLVVLKPVVVIMDTAWKLLYLNASPAGSPLKVGESALPEKIVSAIIGTIILYFITLIAGFLIMSALGLDHVTALSSVFATLGNIGPGLGLVGPTANYLFIPPLGKVVLIVCMLAGRLELLTIFVLFAPSFWKWR